VNYAQTMNKQKENKSAPARANTPSFFQSCSFLTSDEEDELARLSVGSVSASKSSFRQDRSSTSSRPGSVSGNARPPMPVGTSNSSGHSSLTSRSSLTSNSSFFKSRPYASKGSFAQDRSSLISSGHTIAETSHVRPPVETSTGPFFKSQSFISVRKDADAEVTTSESSPTDVKKYDVQPSASASPATSNSGSASSATSNSGGTGVATADAAIPKNADGPAERNASILSYENPNDSYVTLIAKIWELEITNTEVLETIDDKIMESVGEESFLLKERLDAWRYTGKAVLVPTLNCEESFVDGKLEKYEDVVRLNGELLDVAEELSKNKERCDALRTIILNYRCLQACTQEITKLTTSIQDEDVSKLGTLDIPSQTAKEVPSEIVGLARTQEISRSTTSIQDEDVSKQGTPDIPSQTAKEVPSEFVGLSEPSKISTDVGTARKLPSVVDVSKPGKTNTDVGTAKKMALSKQDLPSYPSFVSRTGSVRGTIITDVGTAKQLVWTAKKSALSRQETEQKLQTFSSFLSETGSVGSVLGKIHTDVQKGQKFPSFKHFENIECNNWLEGKGHQVWTLGVITLDTDNKFILTDGDRAHKNISVWDLDTKKLADNVASHHESIYKFLTIKLRNGRQCFASAGYYDTTLRIWCLLSEEEIGKMEMGSKIRGLCTFTLEDGRTCVAAGCSEDNMIQIWSAESYEKLEILKGHSGIVYCLCVFTFEEDGCAFMASGSDDGTIKIWNLFTLQLVSTLDNHMNVRITALTIYINSKGRRLLVSGNNEGRVDIWELNSYRLINTLEEETGHYICSFALFSIEGESDCLAYGCQAGKIKIWDLENMRYLKTLSTGGIDNVEIILATTNRNGKACLLACDSSSTVKIWE